MGILRRLTAPQDDSFLYLFMTSKPKFLGGKGQLGDHIGLGGTAIKRIVFRGDVQVVRAVYGTEIILHMKAVGLGWLAVNVVPLTTIVPLQLEALFRVNR